ncbi:MAG TPA: poly-gamma-glutamate biosynthesis protein PgsC/CapC, partial [Rectinemataceae bacterium]
VILFGRRRFMAAILLSLAGTWLVETLLFKQGFLPRDLRSIGYVIPGLIANDMLKQGVWKTLAATALAAALVRLLLFALAF